MDKSQGKRMKSLDELGLWKLAWPELQQQEGGESQNAEGGQWSRSASASSGSHGQATSSSAKLPAAFRFGHKGNPGQAATHSRNMQPPEEESWDTPAPDTNAFMMQRLMMAQQAMLMGMGSQAREAAGEDQGNDQGEFRRRFTVTEAGGQEGWEQSLEEENRYMGYIRDFNEGGGFGFIECPAAKAKYGMDVWIHRRQMFGFAVGEEVSFMVARNHNGQPQARHVIKACDVARIKAKKKAQEQRAELQIRQKRSLPDQPMRGPGGGGVMDEEAAKRFQASLKKRKA